MSICIHGYLKEMLYSYTEYLLLSESSGSSGYFKGMFTLTDFFNLDEILISFWQICCHLSFVMFLSVTLYPTKPIKFENIESV